jgi:hypothetical protein
VHKCRGAGFLGIRLFYFASTGAGRRGHGAESTGKGARGAGSGYPIQQFHQSPSEGARGMGQRAKRKGRGAESREQRHRSMGAWSRELGAGSGYTITQFNNYTNHSPKAKRHRSMEHRAKGGERLHNHTIQQIHHYTILQITSYNLFASSQYLSISARLRSLSC